MFRNGRGKDNSFKGRHELYYRCTGEDIEGDKFIGGRIQIPSATVEEFR